MGCFYSKGEFESESTAKPNTDLEVPLIASPLPLQFSSDEANDLSSGLNFNADYFAIPLDTLLDEKL